jgi:hypothetical protein
VLSLVFTVRFLPAAISQSHGNFNYHFNCNTCKVFDSHTKSSWHSLISFLLSPSTAHSLNSDLRLSQFWLSSWQLSIWHISSSFDWTLHWNYSHFQMNCQSSQSHSATDGQSVCLSVCLGVEPRLGLMTRCFFLFESYCAVHVGRPLWREVGSVICQS